jgi:hypothetical protein
VRLGGRGGGLIVRTEPGVRALLDRLQAARTAGGGWGYRPAAPPHVEPTLWALLALAGTGIAPPRDALGWLLAAQHADGSWGGADGQAPWVTAPAVFALTWLGEAPEARRRGAAWLLGARSATIARDPTVLSTNTELVGWSWTADTLAWVEPTAHALIALRTAGLQHPRRDEARHVLLDRRCENGGWNYGIVRVLGAAAPPYPYTTALATIALHAPASPRALAPDLEVLAGFLDSPLDVYDLAWIVLALDACEADTAPARQRLAAALVEPSSWEEQVHALALATMASALTTGARNPFRLPT